MKYINAKSLLPQELLEELQHYIQGGYLYVPATEEQRRCWGEKSGYKKELRQRNSEIMMAYKNGSTVEYLAGKYYLSEHTIRKIVHGSCESNAAGRDKGGGIPIA